MAGPEELAGVRRLLRPGRDTALGAGDRCDGDYGHKVTVATLEGAYFRLMLATDITHLRQVQRGEVVLDTGLTYDGITPVTVRVTKREGRWNFTDDSGAVAAAGVVGQHLKFPGSIDVGDYSANVSRQAEVSLPGFACSSDEWLNKLPELVAEGSLALYSALLEAYD